MGDWDTPPTEAEMSASGWDSPPTEEEMSAAGDWDSPPTAQEMSGVDVSVGMPAITKREPAVPEEEPTYLGQLGDSFKAGVKGAFNEAKDVASKTFNAGTLAGGLPAMALSAVPAAAAAAGGFFEGATAGAGRTPGEALMRSGKELTGGSMSEPLGTAGQIGAGAIDMAIQAPVAASLGIAEAASAKAAQIVAPHVARLATKAPLIANTLKHAAPFLAELTGEGVESAAVNAAMTDPRGGAEGYKDAVVMGLVGGPLVRAGFKAVGKLLPKKFADLPPEVSTKMADEVQTAVRDMPLVSPETEAVIKAQNGIFENAPIPIKDMPDRPLVFGGVNKEGKLEAVFMDLKVDGTGNHATMPLETREDWLAFGKKALEKKADWRGFSTDGTKRWAALPPETSHSVMGELYTPVTQGDAPLPKKGGTRNERAPLEKTDTFGSDPTLISGEKTATMTPRDFEKTNALPNPDAPVVDPTPKPVALAVEGDRIVAQPHETVPPPKPPIEEPLPKGREVFVGEPKGGGFGEEGGQVGKVPIGKVIGPDPKNPDNVLVKMPGGKTVSHPEFHVHPVDPPAGTFEGLVPPPVAQPDAPAIADVLKRHEEKVGQSFNIFKKITRFFTDERNWKGAHLIGPEDVRNWILRAQSATHLAGSARDEMLRATRKYMPEKKLLGEVQKKLTQVAEGKMSLDDLMKKHPGLGEKFRTFQKDTLTEMQRLSEEIEQLGGIPAGFSELRKTGELDQYLAQAYWAHILPPGEWLRIAPEERIWKGMDFLYKEAQKSKLGFTEEQVKAEALRIMGAEDAVEALRTSPLAKPFTHLLEKKIIPPELKFLMGPDIGGPMRVAISIGSQRAIANQLRVWNEVFNARQADALGNSVNPWWSPARRLASDVMVPNNPRVFGRAAGGWVPKEMEGLIEATRPQPIAHGMGIYNYITRGIKRNMLVMGGARAFVNNFMRNPSSALLAGGILPGAPVRTAQGFREATRALVDHWHNPSDPTGQNMVVRARALGVTPAGWSRMEAADVSNRKLVREVADYYKKNRGDGLWSQAEKLEALAEAWGKVNRGAGFAYDMIDQWWRLGSWRVATKEYVRNGMSLAAAEAKAAMDINESFANYEFMGKVPDAIRKAPAGAVAMFASGNMEEVRIRAMLPKRIAKDPALRWRLAGAAMWMSAAYAATKAMRQYNGVTDEDIAATEALRSQADKTYSPGLYHPGLKDKNGALVAYDLQQPFAELQFLNGSEDDAAWRRILVNSLAGNIVPVAGTPTETAIRALSSSAGFTRPEMDFQRRFIEGQQGFGEMLKTASDMRLVPGVFQDTYNKMRKMGVMGTPKATDNRFTTGTGIAAIAGLAVKPGIQLPRPGAMDTPATKAATLSYAGELGDLKKQLISVATNSQLTDAEKAKLQANIQARIRFVQDKRQKQEDAVKAYQRK